MACRARVLLSTAAGMHDKRATLYLTLSGPVGAARFGGGETCEEGAMHVSPMLLWAPNRQRLLLGGWVCWGV